MSIERAIKTYILAKDGNRPFLMPQAFADDCKLEMIVHTDAITFPSTAEGLQAISDTLVSRFAAEYENVFTFCLTRPTPAARENFTCPWLVGMSARRDQAVRVGCGHYDWHFDDALRVRKLIIRIDVMNVLPASTTGPVFAWLSALPYPWCTRQQALDGIPRIDALSPIKVFLQES